MTAIPPPGESSGAASADHLLLTRFSAVFRGGLPPAEDEWLWSRLELFERVCLPSVTAQTAPVTWLVFFDDRCPDGFRGRVETLAGDTFVPVWTHERFATAGPAAAGEHASGTHLITTRLDSDDAIAADFCARVQAEFAGQELLYVSFPRGLQVDRQGRVYRYAYPSGPFLSLIERRPWGGAPRTVFGGGGLHRRARTLGPLREVQSPPMWLQIVHGGNIANGIRGVRTSPEALERFAIDLGEPPRPGPFAAGRQHLDSQVGRLRLWARHPRHFADWLHATADRLRGTHTKPRSDRAATAAGRVARRLRRG